MNKAFQLNDAWILIEEVDIEDPGSLRQNAEMLKDKLGRAIVMLASIKGEKVSFVCFVSKDLLEQGLHAGKIVAAAAQVAGGGGGGRPDMAQAGGRDKSKISEALAEARKMVKKTLS